MNGQLIRAELGKLRTRSSLATVIAGAAAIVALLSSQILNSGRIGAPSLGTTANVRAMLSSVGVMSTVMLIIGIISVTSEFRHGTISTTFLVTPNRPRLMTAKTLAVGAVGVAVALGSVALVMGISVPLFMSRGVDFDLANPDLLLVLVGVLAGIPLFGVMGVGFGAIIRHQTAAIMIPLIWFQVVENALPSYGLRSMVKWLPSGATSALGRAEIPDLLPMWGGALLLTVYAVSILGVGLVRLDRADIS